MLPPDLFETFFATHTPDYPKTFFLHFKRFTKTGSQSGKEHYGPKTSASLSWQWGLSCNEMQNRETNNWHRRHDPRCCDPIKAPNQIFCFFAHQILLFCLMQGFRVFVFSSRIDHILLPHCSKNIPAILPQIGVFHLFRVSQKPLVFCLLFGVAKVLGPNPLNQPSPRSISKETERKRKDSAA